MSPLTLQLAPAFATLAFLAASAGGEAGDSPERTFFVLTVTPLQAAEAHTIRVASDGLVERWNASGGRVTGVGQAQLRVPATLGAVELAESMPAEGAMGDGVREGDIWVLATQPSGAIRAFLEPVAPDGMRRLVEDAERLSQALDMRPPKEHYLRGLPVEPERARKLRSAGVPAVSWRALAEDARAIADRARVSPYEFVPIPAEQLDIVRGAVTARATGTYFELEDSSWIEIELWTPA